MTFQAARRLRMALAACALSLATTLLPMPIQAQEGAAAVQDVTLTDVTFPLGGTTVRIPKLVASGTRLSKDDLAGIFRAGSPEPWTTRLARLDATSLTAPVLQADYVGAHESRQSTTYREVVARDVRAGRIAELTASGATLSITTGGPDGKGAGTYGALRATDVDLGALARLATEPGDGKGPGQRIYGTLQVSDLAFSYERGTTVKIARFEGREIGARQVPNGWDKAFDALGAGFDEPANRQAALSAAADLTAALSLGSLEVRGLSVSDTAALPPVLTEIARVTYAAAGSEAGLTLEDLTTADTVTRTHLGKVRLAGGSLAPFVAVLRRMAGAPDDALTIGEMRQLAAGLGTLKLTDFTTDLPVDPPVTKRGAADLPQKEARGDSRSVTRAKVGEARPADPKAGDPLAAPPAKVNRILLKEAMLGPGSAAVNEPGSTRLTLTGLQVPADVAGGFPLLGALPAYGYGDLTFDLAADASWDEAGRTVVVRDVTLSGKDIGRLQMAAVFGGIGPELFSGSVPAQTMLMFSGNARTLDLTVENTGLFERFLAAQAKDLSLKPDELRKEYVTASVLGVPVILGNGPAAKEIGAAMGQFVMNPGKLTIRARSKEQAGVGFIELGTARSPAAVLDRLDVEARAN